MRMWVIANIQIVFDRVKLRHLSWVHFYNAHCVQSMIFMLTDKFCKFVLILFNKILDGFTLVLVVEHVFPTCDTKIWGRKGVSPSHKAVISVLSHRLQMIREEISFKKCKTENNQNIFKCLIDNLIYDIIQNK